MIEYGLLGEKLGHSFSPQIHRALTGCDYRLLPTAPEAVEDLLRRREFKGLNVTIPYKQTVVPLCDEIDPRAAAIGAVNTVVCRKGRLTGYNTDLDGIKYLAGRAGVDMAGKKVVILGSGGTSRTARAAAEELGAAEIAVISRRGEDSYDNLSRHADAQVLINTTPVGMYPNCGLAPVSLDDFPNLTGVLDAVYNPLRTALVMAAEERGLPCSCGLPMLGCGKSAVGRALAQRLGKEFLDLDQLLEAEARKPIPAIFAQEGEDAFRELESRIVREAGARTGCVLSTGGGVVTRRENYAPLRQNGVIIHLTRDLSRLPKAGRPVSQSTDLRELWERRRPLYASFADLTIDNNGPLEETLDKIEKELNAR